MSDIAQQLDLFAVVNGTYKIEKPIRLIELFSGIGAQSKALETLGVPFEHWKTCEWAYNSIIAYDAIHIKNKTDYSKDLTKQDLVNYLNGNISVNYNEPADLTKWNEEKLRKCYNSVKATHNLMNIMKAKGKDLEITDTDKYEYILTYSFPCQDLSPAGLGKGMSVSQADGGTRSGLLWEVERLLGECENKPQILIMENVPEVIGTNNIKDFQKWEYRLSQWGYKNHIQILNGKNYGIPQNRRRCFMVSILNGDYQFPMKTELKYRLKDFLEHNVDEKYYLSEKMIQYITADNDKWIGNNNDATINKDIGCTINTAPGQRRCDASNYVSEDLPPNTSLKKVIETNNKALNETINGKELENADFIDAYNRDIKKDVSGTITTRVSESNNTFVVEGIPIKNNTKKGYTIAEVGDGVDISSRMETHRGTVQKGLCQTINTQGTDGGGSS